MASKEAIALIEGILAQGITLDQIPAARPPQGTTSNLDDPVSRAYQITICNVVCLFVVCIIVGVRLFTRIRIVKSVGIDDCLYLDHFFARHRADHERQTAQYSPSCAGSAKQHSSNTPQDGEQENISGTFPSHTCTRISCAGGWFVR